ncbi:MAG: hypothetical protein SRB1_01353 [Desulfobacteraceae bacterium Eth-SRB1]|nr:MAG: hypothetical protein SRB1_01353 [Desulfobacteraceae bacterium Eth-SRB1]
MKKLQDQLKSISRSLVSLSKQVDKATKQLGKLQPPKTTSSVKKKKNAAIKSRPAAKKAKTSKIKKKPAKETTVLDKVFAVIKKSRNGASIDTLKEKTGLISRQLSNALYKLAKKGHIKAKGRGLYIKK